MGTRPLSLTTDPILQLIWRIGIPASVGMFFNTLFNFVFTFGWGLLAVWWGCCIVTWSAAIFALWWGWRTVRLPR